MLQDGRKPSIWDMFCEIPGKILNGDTGVHADLSYDRYHADVQLMKDMGLTAVRFSISWPRILPDGSGAINPLGLSHYNDVINTLISNDITPIVALFHWGMVY